MAQMLIRNLDDDVKAALFRQARRNGRSTEEEARVILSAAVAVTDGEGIGSRWSRAFGALGVLEIPPFGGDGLRIPDFESEFDS